MKYIVLFGLILSVVFMASHSFAQTQKQYNEVKERIQKELNVDEAKADSTASILKNYFTAVKHIRSNEGMSDQRKQLAIRSEKREQVAKLKTILSQEQLRKLRQMVQQYRDMRQQSNDNPADTSLSKYYF